MNDISRRDFFAKGGAVAAGAALLPLDAFLAKASASRDSIRSRVTTDEDKLPVGQTHGKTIRYVQEDPHGRNVSVSGKNLKTHDEPVVVRDWDVLDPKARNKAARKALGDLTAFDNDPKQLNWDRRAQWFIDSRRNAAALCVYRPAP